MWLSGSSHQAPPRSWTSPILRCLSPLRCPLLRCGSARRRCVCGPLAAPWDAPVPPAAPCPSGFCVSRPRATFPGITCELVRGAFCHSRPLPVGALPERVFLLGDTVPHLSYGRVASPGPRVVSWGLLGPAARGRWLFGPPPGHLAVIRTLVSDLGARALAWPRAPRVWGALLTQEACPTRPPGGLTMPRELYPQMR